MICDIQIEGRVNQRERRDLFTDYVSAFSLHNFAHINMCVFLCARPIAHLIG